MNKQLPIDPMILERRRKIPSMIVEISYQDEGKAIEYLRIWGRKEKPVTSLYEELRDLIDQQAG